MSDKKMAEIKPLAPTVNKDLVAHLTAFHSQASSGELASLLVIGQTANGDGFVSSLLHDKAKVIEMFGYIRLLERRLLDYLESRCEETAEET